MNRIVRDHYPIEKLPDDLRALVDPSRPVTVVLEQRDAPEPPMTLDELFALRRPPYLNKQEIDDHIRSLRDEWHE